MEMNKLFVFSNDGKNINVVGYYENGQKEFYNSSEEGLDVLNMYMKSCSINDIKITNNDQAIYYLNNNKTIMIDKLSNVLKATKGNDLSINYYKFFTNNTKKKLKSSKNIVINFVNENKTLIITGSLTLITVITGFGLEKTNANNYENIKSSVVTEVPTMNTNNALYVSNINIDVDNEATTIKTSKEVETTVPAYTEEITFEETTIPKEIETAFQTEEYTTSVYNDDLGTKSSHITYTGGVFYYGNHRETYYEEEVLPGPGLHIPGRHVEDDGTIRDIDNYICVASDFSFMPYGSIVETSLGTAKVYDTGCAYGTIDIYVNGQTFKEFCRSEKR